MIDRTQIATPCPARLLLVRLPLTHPPPQLGGVVMVAIFYSIHPSIVHCDDQAYASAHKLPTRVISTPLQLGVVVMVAIFYFYPSIVRTTLLFFACYKVSLLTILL